MRVAFLGIGLMGLPMSTRLLQSHFPLTAWNRTTSKADPLKAYGANIVESTAAAVEGADVTILMLENDDVVNEVLTSEAMQRALRPGSMVIDMSSVSPNLAREHAKSLERRGLRYIDAPVSGGVGGAESGTLAIMAGGHAADIEAVAPLWSAMGRVTHVGGHGCGQLAKLANQMIVGMSIGAVAEAMYLVERRGGDPLRTIAAMSGGFADSKILSLHGTRMAKRDFAKRATMRVQLKDLRNALHEGDGLNLPITQLVQDLFGQAIENGDAELDHSALWREIDRMNVSGRAFDLGRAVPCDGDGVHPAIGGLYESGLGA